MRLARVESPANLTGGSCIPWDPRELVDLTSECAYSELPRVVKDRLDAMTMAIQMVCGTFFMGDRRGSVNRMYMTAFTSGGMPKQSKDANNSGTSLTDTKGGVVNVPAVRAGAGKTSKTAITPAKKGNKVK